MNFIDEEILDKFHEKFDELLKNDKSLKQYTREEISPVLDIFYTVFNYIMDKGYRNVLNVGTGSGIFEYICNINGVNVNTTESIAEPDKEIYAKIREYFNIKVNYNSTDYFLGYKILDCKEKFDVGIVSRFGPFQFDDINIFKLENFLLEIFHRCDNVIVFKHALSEPVEDYIRNKGKEDRIAYTINKKKYVNYIRKKCLGDPNYAFQLFLYRRIPVTKDLIHFPIVNRVEVIDENGRSYVKYFCNNVKMCLQDDGYTLKLFLDKENKDESIDGRS